LLKRSYLNYLEIICERAVKIKIILIFTAPYFFRENDEIFLIERFPLYRVFSLAYFWKYFVFSGNRL